jgi:hypothetical protein
MQRIQDPTAVSALPAAPALSGPAGYFTGGNPTGGIPATRVRAWWLNMVQEEILGVVQAAGLTPNASATQLRQALRVLYGGSNEWVKRVLTEVGITPDVNDDLQLLTALHTLYNGPKNWLQSILTEAGIAPNPAVGNQVMGALNALFIRRSEFTNVMGSPGYMRTPGAMFQWGTAVSTSGATPVVFPVAFPTAPLSVICTEQNAEGWGFPPAPTIYGAHGANQNGFSAYACRIQTNGIPGYSAGLSFNWMAVGY